MKLHTFAAVAALAAFSAGAALASEPVTVTLQQPVAEKTEFIAGGALFACQAAACRAAAPAPQTFSTSTCKAIAAKVGPVSAFSGRKAFDSARLADCNAAVVARAPGARLARQ